MTEALAALLNSIIDYAGLFPPASASMSQTVRNHRAYLKGDHQWMLARLIVPAARLGELEEGMQADDAWRLSALAGSDWEQDLVAVESFNRRHSGAARIDALEFKASSASDIERALGCSPEALQPYIEISIGEDLERSLSALEGTRARAKIRTGGLQPEAIPPAEAVAQFLVGCARRGIGFKATAGLHHPLRGKHPLGYHKGSPQAVMHGFLNLFLAAVRAHQGGSEAEVSRILLERAPRAFRFEGSRACWRGECWEASEIEAARRFAISFGSCSFAGPLQDLERMGLL